MVSPNVVSLHVFINNIGNLCIRYILCKRFPLSHKIYVKLCSLQSREMLWKEAVTAFGSCLLILSEVFLQGFLLSLPVPSQMSHCLACTLLGSCILLTYFPISSLSIFKKFWTLSYKSSSLLTILNIRRKSLFVPIIFIVHFIRSFQNRFFCFATFLLFFPSLQLTVTSVK